MCLNVCYIPRPLDPKLVPLHPQQPERAGTGDQHDRSYVGREERGVSNKQEQAGREHHRRGHRCVQEHAMSLHLPPGRQNKGKKTAKDVKQRETIRFAHKK